MDVVAHHDDFIRLQGIYFVFSFYDACPMLAFGSMLNMEYTTSPFAFRPECSMDVGKTAGAVSMGSIPMRITF